MTTRNPELLRQLPEIQAAAEKSLRDNGAEDHMSEVEIRLTALAWANGYLLGFEVGVDTTLDKLRPASLPKPQRTNPRRRWIPFL